MTVKEQLVELVQAEGYDFITASEIASVAIKEANTMQESVRTYYIGYIEFTLKRSKDDE